MASTESNQPSNTNACNGTASPKGWLDIHVHFSLPPHSKDEAQQAMLKMRQNDFLISPDWKWAIEDSLRIMDSTSVQMGMLSCPWIPSSQIHKANTFGAKLVGQYPTHFGLLYGLPTDDASVCLRELEFGEELQCDGYWVNPVRDGMKLSDPSLDPVWARLNETEAVVWLHLEPNEPSVDGRPGALLEVTYTMQRVIIDQIYRKHFLRYPNIKHIYSSCAGGLLGVVGRLEMVGTEDWVPNPNHITRKDIDDQVKALWVDVAAYAEDGVVPSVKHLGQDRVVFDSDTGAPCMCMDGSTRYGGQSRGDAEL